MQISETEDEVKSVNVSSLSAFGLTKYVQKLTVSNGLGLAVWNCFPSAAQQGASYQLLKVRG